jgi:hypothetical protein
MQHSGLKLTLLYGRSFGTVCSINVPGSSVALNYLLNNYLSILRVPNGFEILMQYYVWYIIWYSRAYECIMKLVLHQIVKNVIAFLSQGNKHIKDFCLKILKPVIPLYLFPHFIGCVTVVECYLFSQYFHGYTQILRDLKLTVYSSTVSHTGHVAFI